MNSRLTLFEGNFCRVVKVHLDDNMPQTTYIVETQDGRDALGHTRWTTNLDGGRGKQAFEELAEALDKEKQRGATRPVANAVPPKSKKS